MQPFDLESRAVRHGIRTTRMLAADGVTERVLDRLVREGDLIRLHRSVYVDASVPLGPLARAWAAAVAGGHHSVPSHRTAAAALGLWLPPHWYGEPADVTVPLDVHRRRRASLHPHRRPLQLSECERTDDGLVLTGARRTVIDVSREHGRFAGVIAAESAIRTRWLTLADVRALPAAEVALLADPRSESPAESLARLVFHDAGITLVPQFEFWDEYDRCMRRLDLADPVRRVGIEIDGRGYREDQLEPAYVDRHKHNLLGRGDWIVLRFTWRDLVRRPGYVVACVRAALSARAA